MITVEQALSHLFALVEPSEAVNLPLKEAAGRTLATDVQAQRDQPPFAASAMDGYAIGDDDPKQGDTYRVIGEAAAGHAWSGRLKTGEALRIFTGAPLPEGAVRVIIQEDVTRQGDIITIGEDIDQARYVRPSGADFKASHKLCSPRKLSPNDIALLAAMNIANVPVVRKPQVAIIATGDELVQPGEAPRPDQIIASNSYGLAALVDANGGKARLLPIAKDNIKSLEMAFELAKGADLIITIGGASVGDHDLVGGVAKNLGMEQSFYKVAMRPGKPLMAGKLGGAAMVGLPGNPVSAMVCGHIFILPMLRKMLGHGENAAPRQPKALAQTIGTNGPREHYMRGKVDGDHVTVFERQDSALLTVLADANCLIVRPANDPTQNLGAMVDIIHI